MKRLFSFLLTISLIALAGCNEINKDADDDILHISTFTVGKAVEQQLRTLKGIVVPAEQTPLGFRFSGEIVSILVKAGDLVSEGQMLAKLDNTKEMQAYNDAKAKLTLADSQLKRGKELFTKKMLSSSELDELTAKQRIAEVTYEVAKNKLDYTVLYAPFSGKISEVHKERFERVEIAQPVITLYQNKQVYVRIDLSDSLIFSVNPETSLKVRNYRPEVAFWGIKDAYFMKYLEHSSEPDQETKAYQLYLSMPQLQQEILPGTGANIIVDMVAAGMTSINGYNLPLTALQATDQAGKFYVWKVVGDSVTKIAVKVHQIKANAVVVSSGISQGDKLVNSNLRKLREGLKVHLLEQK